jgi:DNA mismatch endonuclease (patch repair protein)
MDSHSKEVRSYNMSQIRSKNTKPEELVRKALFTTEFRYRKNDKRLQGHPDIVLKKYRTVIFVNGCFWHKHENCRYFVWPKSNTKYWKNKINGNIKRDKQNYLLLRKQGWNVIIIWECKLKLDKRYNNLISLIKRIKRNL